MTVMKRAAKLGGNAMTGIIGKQIVKGAAGLTYAVKYCRAAQSEEKNGFAFTAAVEWQKAAELLSPVPFLADRCWKQWERIMRLPRRLAAPIAEVQTPSSEECHAVLHAGYISSEPDEFVARVAEVLFGEQEIEQSELEFPMMAQEECMAAAA